MADHGAADLTAEAMLARCAPGMVAPLAVTQPAERALAAAVADSPQACVNGGLVVPVQAAAGPAVGEAVQCRCVGAAGVHQ